MTTFLHLVRKEARDVRWHLRGGLLALVALTFLFAWLASDEDAETYRSVIGMALFWAVPSGAMLAGAAVAAELFAGECASRRVDATALLPVPLSHVFRAKCATVGIAWFLGGLVMAVVAPVAALAFDPGVAGVAEAAATGALVALGTAPAVASVVLFACILEHGLGSVLAGFASLGLLGGLAAWLGAWEDWGVRPENALVLAACVPVTAALLWGAWLAFTRGPIHLGVRLRRFALGAGAGLGSIVVTGAAGAAVLDSRVDLEPGDPDAHAWQLRVSPDGAFAVVSVSNTRTDSTSQAWSIRLADGHAIRIPGRHVNVENWGAPGTARVLGADGTSRGETVEIDLATGAMLPPIDAGETSDPSWPAFAWNDRWARIVSKDRGLSVAWPERGLSRTFETWRNVVVSPVPGRFLVGGRGDVVDLASGREWAVGAEGGGIQWGTHRWVDGGRALTFVVDGQRRLLDCETGEVRELSAPGGHGIAEFGDGRYASFVRTVRDEAGAPAGAAATPAPKTRRVTCIVDIVTGLEVKREGAGESAEGWLSFVPGSEHFAVTQSGPAEYALVDCRTGRATASIPQLSWNLPMNRIQELPDGRLLVADDSAQVWILAADGTVVRRVFPSGERR